MRMEGFEKRPVVIHGRRQSYVWMKDPRSIIKTQTCQTCSIDNLVKKRGTRYPVRPLNARIAIEVSNTVEHEGKRNASPHIMWLTGKEDQIQYTVDWLYTYSNKSYISLSGNGFSF